MQNKIVSIIVPVYNVEKYLDRCVESIVNQTYKNLEIILVDDGSPDNCSAMCDEWAKKDNRIKVIHKENGGVSSARNIAIKNATGDLIEFVDSDDFIDKNYTETLIGDFDNSCLLVCGGYKIVSLNGNVKEFIPYEFKNKYIMENVEDFFDFVLSGYFDYTVNKLYKSDIVKELRFDENKKIGEDRKFNTDYMRKATGDIKYAMTAGYNYMFNASSATHTKRMNAYEIFRSNLQVLIDFAGDCFDNSIKCDGYYRCVGRYISAVASLSPYKNLSANAKKLKDDDIVIDYIKNYKPQSKKEKIRHFLIKHNLYKFLKFVSLLKIKIS